MNIQEVKQRFGIIGASPLLDRALHKALQVAPTDISVLITGESGVGKEAIPKIIHQLSYRKHNPYIAVNCGAIPEGTIDSELFGHEKGAFTGATGSRKGYFEEADGGTIFLDEVGELPMQTQVRLLRVLETGEYIKVGSSKIHKTDVRVVGATNVNMKEAIQKNKFREDLYYRLNTIEIKIPALRDRHDDIYLLFRKFAADFADKYHTPAIRLTLEAQKLITSYRWPGNIRQLRNLVEQISVIETDREIGPESIRHYIPDVGASELPMLINKDQSSDDSSFGSEREIMYKLLFDMRSDMNNLKKLVTSLLDGGSEKGMKDVNPQILKQLSDQISEPPYNEGQKESYVPEIVGSVGHDDDYINTATIEDENLSLQDKEIEMIKKALERNRGKRKGAAEELGISERTLYRKIKQFELY
jgi:DNA-binding NtrC family response regulator